MCSLPHHHRLSSCETTYIQQHNSNKISWSLCDRASSVASKNSQDVINKSPQRSQAFLLLRRKTKTAHQPPILTNNLTNQIGDALVKLKVPYGGYLHGLKMFSPLQQAGDTKIFGPAYTVQMVDAANTSAPKPAKHFADGIEKDCVVFVSQPKGFYSACWGGLMSTRAKYVGAQGVVVDGCFRDINEHRGMGFPVSSRTERILLEVSKEADVGDFV